MGTALPEPMLPVGLFRDRNFSGASLSVVLMSFSAGGLLLALTQYLQFVLGYSPLKAGVAFIPLLLAAMVCNGIGVVIDKRFGARVAVGGGLALLAVGFGVLAMLSPGDGYPMLVTALVIMGMGSGTMGPAAYGTLLGALPPERAGVGSAVNDTVQQLGQALSVAVLGSVLSAAYSDNLPDAVTGPARESVGDALAVAAASGDAALAAAARNAFTEAVSTTAVAGVIGGAIAAVLAFVVLRPTPAARPTTEPETADDGDDGKGNGDPATTVPG
ncbi:MFS transporter [Actinomadura sp. J1-007]|uniref:MFS transporter n=1 Tax=Actinomadura sp. J1-007 TaxID=2661913 RepID=UPI002815D3FB|nr:MFS transporter [Actinomadura sp. J1-007]